MRETKGHYKDIISELAAAKGISAAIREPLEWHGLEGKRACRIKKSLDIGGYRNDEEEWNAIHGLIIDAMIRLEKALGPELKKLRM